MPASYLSPKTRVARSLQRRYRGFFSSYLEDKIRKHDKG